MSNRSIRDERQDVSKRAGAPGRGSLFGKKAPPGTPSPGPATDPATRDISVGGAIKKLKGRKGQIDKAIEDAS